MGFKEDLLKLAEQIGQRKDVCAGNEEATKQALILPFLQVLGYDVWNPLELKPEYRAGWAVNREKVDYALYLNGKPAAFIEAKPIGGRLENYDAQLAKYFNSTPEIKLAIITDGQTYKFFTDTKAPNLMDSEPFFELKMEHLRDLDIEILSNFRKDNFNVDAVITQAENLFYLNGFLKKLRHIFANPSDDFIRFIASDIFQSRMTANVVDRLRPIVQQAVSQTLLDMVSKGLSRGISEDSPAGDAATDLQSSEQESSKIETTEEELGIYQTIVDMIVAERGHEHKVNYKDTQSYFSIQIERPNKWFCRLHMNNQKRKYIAFRLPENVAKILIHPELVQAYISSTTEGCSVTYEGPETLAIIKPLVIEAYNAIESGSHLPQKDAKLNAQEGL